MDKYCKKFVEDIFLKRDTDMSGVLERRELKNWVRDELKTHPYYNKKMVQTKYDEFFTQVDTNNDGKIDRWELYDYCVKNITPEDNDSWLFNQIDCLSIHITDISINQKIQKHHKRSTLISGTLI